MRAYSVKASLFVLTLALLSACGKDDSRPNSAIQNALATDPVSVLSGNWKLGGIRCGGVATTSASFLDSVLLASGSAVSSTFSISTDPNVSARMWTLGSCQMTTPMEFGNFTSSSFTGVDKITSCNSGCSAPFDAVCGAPVPVVVTTYPYTLRSNKLTVTMADAFVSTFCGPGQSGPLTFVYQKL